MKSERAMPFDKMTNYPLKIMMGLSRRLGSKARTSGLQRTRFGRALTDLAFLPSDFGTIRLQYKETFGTFPNVIAPTTFNECLQQFKLFNVRSKYTTRSDKILVRDYVAEKIGNQYLSRLLWSGTDLRAVEPKTLPQSFVIKANHGSGTNIIVKNKDSFDWDAACRTTEEWLRADYSIGLAERQYRWIPPQLLIEELLVGEDGEPPIDYKFYVFGGSVRFVELHFERFSNHSVNMYDRTFGRLNVTYKGYPSFEGTVEKPGCYDEMIALAEALSDGERFVRVDLYDIGRPVFGELTYTPNSGLIIFDPPDFDKLLGESYRESAK